MSVIRKMAYLEAMGIDAYVSRSQLVGAAPTRRLSVVNLQEAHSPLTDSAARHQAAPAAQGGPASGATQLLDALRSSAPKPLKSPSRSLEPQDAQQSTPTITSVPRFSLAVISSGNWLWLELLGEIPLMSEQVWLIESMATALRVANDKSSVAAGTPIQKSMKAKVMQFDWPMHNNPQLDGGAEAAIASLGGFLERQQSEHQAQGVVLLGTDAADWVSSNSSSAPVIVTHSTAEMLAAPLLKQQVWRHLRSLLPS